MIGEDVALKVRWGNSSAEDIRNEARIMTNLKGHPNIGEILGFGYRYVITRFYRGGTLTDVVLGPTGFLGESNLARFYAMQLGKAVRHMHEHNIIHGDIKPCNVVLDGTNVRLIDLGNACDENVSQMTIK